MVKQFSGGNTLEVTQILAEIEAQISKLQQAHALLSGLATTGSATAAPAKKKVGRPKKTVSAVAAPVKAAKATKKKRTLSAEARKRIAEAQKKRWAEKRKSAA